MNELISVIVRAYNSEKYIMEALSSIIENTYRENIEIIVCYDNDSKDKTLYNIKKFILKYKNLENRMIKLVKHSHTTAFHALNIGFSNATGSYIFILDYDNLYPKKHIETMVNIAKETKKDFLFVSDYFFVGPKKIIGKSKIPDDPCNLKNLIQRNYVDGNAIMMNRECLSIISKKLSLIDHRLCEWAHEDWLIALLALKNCKCYHSNKSYVYYRKHKNNLTGIYNTNIKTNILVYLRNLLTLIAFYDIEGETLKKSEINVLERALIKNYLVIAYYIGKDIPRLPLHRIFLNFTDIYNKLRNF